MFDRRVRRTTLKTSTAAVALLAFAAPAVVHAQTAKYSFDIPSQDVSSALIAYGRMARQQLVFDGTSIRNKHSAALVGEYSAEEGLSRLLEGTGLQAEFAGSGAIRIVSASNPQSGSAAGDGADGTVQALIVTAQKREENIQDVPIAMSAFTQEALDRSQVAGGRDLMTQVPNMTFTKTNFTGYSIQIRGIGTQAVSATTDAAVAVSFNNTSFIRNRFFEQEFYDLQRVEVLRGPQGTLYGRNATAGVVNLISQKPKFTYEAKLSADVSNYSSTRFEGMVNVPLVEDKVALRLAGAWTKRDGFVENQITGDPIDGRDLWSTRLSLRFTPTDRLDANLIWEHFQEDDDRLRSGKQLCHQDKAEVIGTAEHRVVVDNSMGKLNTFSQGCLPASMYTPESFEAPNGYSLPYYYPLIEAGVPIIDGLNPYLSLTQSRDLRVIESTVDPKYRAKNDLVELQWSYDLNDNLTLTSETSYLYDTIFSLEDYNRFNTTPGVFAPNGNVVFRPDVMHIGPNGFPEFCDPQIGCADRLVAMDVSTAKSKQFSQEFRLSSDFDGPLNFSVGANYLRYDTEDKYYVFINTLTMFAAASTFGVQGGPYVMPWQPNGTDNHECFSRGMQPPQPDTYVSIRGCMYIDPNPVDSLNDLGHNYFLSKNPYKLMSYALFGEAYWNISDNLKLTAGLRVTRDQKEAPRIPSELIAARSVGYVVTGVEDQEWTEPTGRLAIDWKPDLSFTDETLLYASYSHGYKAGGANPPPAAVTIWDTIGVAATAIVNRSAARPKTFNPEFVDAFELGSKNTFADGAVTLNLAAFYYDYTGYQISQIIDRSATNYNFDAKIWGLEVEADWRPLENLRLGFKGGYEHTEIADGERAIDIMDRTAGQAGWVVVRPYPTFPSNCVLPTSAIDPDGDGVSGAGVDPGSGVGPCDAYTFGRDPVTGVVYTDDQAPASPPDPFTYPNYPGYNPKHDVGQNYGEGFFKQLGGNELPNAPHFTGTITADYTLPLPSDWLMTLHTDLYYQSEAWTRVFNTPGYDKLKAYTNVNLAAIFTNEDAGWKVMAYVKNVFDRDSITGAFLNSDDTGLTTNVFLTEPRLYGLRVTKEFDGGPWWTGSDGTGPYPLWVEVGGTVLRQDAPYQTLAPASFDGYAGALDPRITQHRNFDWGDQREVRLTYKPAGARYSLRAEYRYGDANTGTARSDHREAAGPGVCPPFFVEIGLGYWCDNPAQYGIFLATGTNWMDSATWSKEEHTLAEFAVGMDVGLGALTDGGSVVAAGLRFGQFHSHTSTLLDGVADFYVAPDWYSNYNRYRSIIDAEREFEGAGPMLSWEAASHLLGNEGTGHVNLDWAIAGGVLFGKQETVLTEADSEFHWDAPYNSITPDWDSVINMTPRPTTVTSRSEDISVPFLDLSLGLSYEIQRIKVGAGYRWERYFNVLDAGYAEHKDYDRTMDGPYFKVAVGFGG